MSKLEDFDVWNGETLGITIDLEVSNNIYDLVTEYVRKVEANEIEDNMRRHGYIKVTRCAKCKHMERVGGEPICTKHYPMCFKVSDYHYCGYGVKNV